MKAIRVLLLTAGLTTLAACGTSQKNGIFVTFPKASATKSVSVGGGSTAASVDLVAQRLTAAGFTITGKNAAGTVSARGNSVQNLDCGVLRQVALGNTGVFAGNSEFAAIYTSENPVVFVTRSVSNSSAVTVNVLGNIATVSEAHDVTIVWRSAKKALISNETKRVTGGSVVKFADNTVCTSSGRISNTLAG